MGKSSRRGQTMLGLLGMAALATMLIFGASAPPIAFALGGNGDSGNSEVFGVNVNNDQLVDNGDGTVDIVQEQEQPSQPPQQQQQQQQQQEEQQQGIAVGEPNPAFEDLNCNDIQQRNFPISKSEDVNHFDGDGDGIGCETTVTPQSGGQEVLVEPEQGEAAGGTPATPADVTTATTSQFEALRQQALIELDTAEGAYLAGNIEDTRTHINNLQTILDQMQALKAAEEVGQQLQQEQQQQTTGLNETFPSTPTTTTTTTEPITSIPILENPETIPSTQQGNAIFAEQLSLQLCGVGTMCYTQLIQCGITMIVTDIIANSTNPAQVTEAIQQDPQAAEVALNETGIVEEAATVIGEALPDLATGQTTPAEVAEDLGQVADDNQDQFVELVIGEEPPPASATN